jgi:aspartyl/asparaginyl beta-hydroxylase (cupin superfamily)
MMATTQDFGNSDALVAAADRAMASGDRLRAAQLLEQAAAAQPRFETLLKLASVRRALGDIGAAAEAAGRAVKLAPDNFIALLMLGTLQDAMGAEHRAGRVYRAALRHAPPPHALPPPVRDQLEHARRRVAADDRWLQSVAEWRPSADLSGEAVRWLDGLRASILENSAANQDVPAQFLIPDLKSLEWFEPSDFPGVAEIEHQTDAVRAEFLTLTEAKAPQLAPYLAGLTTAQPDRDVIGKWSMIPLVRGGMVVDEYASLCPLTMRLFEGLDTPQIGMIAPSLYFSVLEPHSRIDPHTGIINARLIVHWPLIVPDSCGFRVGSETREWEPGRALVFDDMIEHEVWNDSDRLRVVLISDLWRPELSASERSAVTRLMDRDRALA